MVATSTDTLVFPPGRGSRDNPSALACSNGPRYTTSKEYADNSSAKAVI